MRLTTAFAFVGIATALVLKPLPVFAGAGDVDDVKDGEAGAILGATAAQALGLPGADERLWSATHSADKPYPGPTPTPTPQGEK